MCSYATLPSLHLVTAQHLGGCLISSWTSPWLPSWGWTISQRRVDIIEHKQISHSSNTKSLETICIQEVTLHNWFDTIISSRKPKNSLLKVIWDELTTNFPGGQVFMLRRWEVCPYATLPSLHLVMAQHLGGYLISSWTSPWLPPQGLTISQGRAKIIKHKQTPHSSNTKTMKQYASWRLLFIVDLTPKST